MNLKLLKTFKPGLILVILIFTLIFSVYLFTLAPNVYVEDAGELTAAATTLGIPHPSGYPLYVLLGKLFTFIPLGSMAWRINLMSAFFGALTAGLLSYFIYKITKNFFIASIASLILAFSPIFWSQSVIAEVYTLNSFFVVLCLIILFLWQEKRQNKYLIIFSFIYGLSLTNHQMMILLAPVFAVFIILADRKIIRNLKLILAMFSVFIIGLSVYLYLPIRSRQNPALDWGNPENFHNFWFHITRGQYSDFSIFSQSFDKLPLFFLFLYRIVLDFYWPLFVLSVFGLIIMYFQYKRMALLTLAVFIFNSLGIILLRDLGWGIENEYLQRVYYLPCFLMLVVWFAFILDYLHKKIKVFFIGNKFFYKLILIIYFIILFTLPLSYLLANYKVNDKSDFWLSHDYYKNLLLSLEPNSVFLQIGNSDLAGDTEIFTLIYLQAVEKVRPDVYVVHEGDYFGDKVSLTLPPNHFFKIKIKRKEALLNMLWPISQENNLNLYTSFIVNKNTSGDVELFSRSNGYANKIYADKKSAKEAYIPPVNLSVRNLEDEIYQLDYSIADTVSAYYYNQATYYMENGKKDLTTQNLVKAINFDNRPFSEPYQDFIKHRQGWQE